jgi:hypothetical protein
VPTITVSEPHTTEQPSPAVALPSSHVSAPTVSPLPHRVVVQFASPPSSDVVLPSSHSSSGETAPLPHAVGRQLASQPSP